MHLKIVLVVFLATSISLVASAPRKNHHKTKLTKQHEQLTETEDNQAIANDEGEEVSSTADDDENSADGGSTSLERIGFQQEVVPVQQTQQQVVQTQQNPTAAQQQNQQNPQQYNNNGNTSSNMLNQFQQQQQGLSSNPSVAATPILNQQNSLATNFGKTFKNVSSDSTKKLHMLTEKDEELKCFNDFGSKMNTTNGKTADKLVEIYEGLHKCLTNRKCNYKKAEVLLKNCITPQNPYQNYTCYYTWYEQIKKDCDPNRGDERPKAENGIPSRGTSQSKLELKDNIITPNDKAS